MGLLLIVLLLDESHLELVGDILKETNFNDKDWDKLGRELRVYTTGQEYSYLDKSSILKECLRGWLTSSFLRILDDDDPPTLYKLANALKRIGYSEAGEYIIERCKLIIMFNDQCYWYTEVIVVSRLL